MAFGFRLNYLYNKSDWIIIFFLLSDYNNVIRNNYLKNFVKPLLKLKTYFSESRIGKIIR